jgi:methyl-accepting chemotaxis protein
MKWFYDLKLSKKLIFSFLIVSFISVLMVWLAIMKLNSIGEQDQYMYDNCVIAIQDLGIVSSKFELAMALTRDPVLNTDEKFKAENVDARNALTKGINEYLKDYESRISTPEEKELYNKFLDARKDLKPVIAKFNEYLKVGNIKEAAKFFTGEFTAVSQNQRDALQNIIQYKTDYAKTLSISNKEHATSAVTGMIILAIIGLIVSMGLGLFVSGVIKKSVAKILIMAQELKKGHVQARSNIDCEDEIGIMAKTLDAFADQLDQFAGAMNCIAQGEVSIEVPMYDKDDRLAPALNGITKALRELLAETKSLVSGAIEGKLSIRGNAEKFNGGYKEIIAGFNGTLDAVIGPLNMAAEYMDRISKGDIPAKITEQYNGDFNEIKNNLNICIDAIQLVITDVYSLSEGAVEGKLNTRADITKHQGDFRKIVQGINGTLDAVTEPLKLASSYMNDISKGVIPKKIEKDLKGDFNEIKTSINDLIHSTNLITTGIHRISGSILNGDLTEKGRPEMVVGAWRVLIVDINLIMETLITNIRFMGKNITAIAKGEIPEKITEEYKGDYNEIKNNLNVCFSSVKALIDDMEDLSQGAIEGKLSKRADATKHQGDFRKIVEGVNDTLDAIIGPLNMAAEYIDRLSKGDIPQTITETYNGDFNEIKNNLNDLMNNMSKIFNGIWRVIDNVNNGNLTDRGNDKMFQGEWRRLTQGINSLTDCLVEPIHFMAGNITKIAKGEIPEAITDAYKGEFDAIKNNLNTCFNSINALIKDMKMLSENAVEGRLSQRADASKHKGDYGKIIEGVNETIEAIVAPINEGVKILEKMSSGDLTVRITSDYKGDHQLIKNSINGVAVSLSKALNDVSEAISATASASNQISSSTEEMAAGASEQTQQATEVAGGVEEMTRTILENTKNASHAAEAAKKAGDKAVEGGSVVKETIEGMNRIADVVRKSADTVQELGKSSDQIGEIVQVIDDIADQTNLLALNAAIEAARAGEQGRGFAVVADEVRKLAERTTKATKEIAGMIKQIQKDTGNAVESMGEGTEEVERGKTLANKAGESLKEIVEESQHVVDIVTQVAAASEEQSSAAEQISKNIEGISSVTQQSAAGTQQIAHAAEDLNRLTLNLESLIEQFNINDSNSGNKSSVVKHS